MSTSCLQEPTRYVKILFSISIQNFTLFTSIVQNLRANLSFPYSKPTQSLRNHILQIFQRILRMGPWKAVALKRKRSVGESSMERRSKQRNDREAPLAIRPRPQPHVSMVNHLITNGRKNSFEFLENEYFKIGNQIRSQGWKKFCTLEVLIYPKLVRSFFENLRFGAETIESTIEDTLIVIDERRICSILEMHRSRICFLNLKKKINGLRVILEMDDMHDLRNLQANRLYVEMRLLHNIVSRIFFSKG